MEYGGIIRKRGPLLFLLFVIAGTVFLAVPTINSNIHDPNMIVYCNFDEGGTMDVIWEHYSGEKRDSFQIGYTDYGLEMVYLADFSRLILSRFIECTPAMFVVILRWIHFLGWIGALIALWRFMGYHFGKRWQQILAVALLAVRPTFAYLLTNLKPDPLTILLVIVGLDFTLRIVDDPSTKNILIAVIIASVTFLIKYIGPFLLPPIIAAMCYVGYKGNTGDSDRKKSVLFREIKFSYLFPLTIGLVVIGLLIAGILVYVRKSTGQTWYEDFGIWGTMMRNPNMLYIFWAGISMAILSALLWLIPHVPNPAVKRIMSSVNKINSYTFVICAVFTAVTLVLGFRWLTDPKLFVSVYVPLGYFALGTGPISMIAEQGFWPAFVDNIVYKIWVFDPLILLLFMFYLIQEVRLRRTMTGTASPAAMKRLILLVFLAIPFCIMFSMVWMTQHHMLPFCTIALVLAIQGLDMLNDHAVQSGRLVKRGLTCVILVVFLADIFYNSQVVIKKRLYEFRQKEDVAYDVSDWLKRNIPYDASIAADHYMNVYIPQEFSNISVYKEHRSRDFRKFCEFIEKTNPRFVYYNMNSWEKGTFPLLEDILPDRRPRLIKSFDSSTKRYQRRDGDKFVIYELSY